MIRKRVVGGFLASCSLAGFALAQSPQWDKSYAMPTDSFAIRSFVVAGPGQTANGWAIDLRRRLIAFDCGEAADNGPRPNNLRVGNAAFHTLLE